MSNRTVDRIFRAVGFFALAMALSMMGANLIETVLVIFGIACLMAPLESRI